MPFQEDPNASSPAPEEDAWIHGSEEDILALHRRPTILGNTTTQAISVASRSYKSARHTQTGTGNGEALRVREDAEAASQGTPVSRRGVLDEAPSELQHTKEGVVESDRTRRTEEVAESDRIGQTEEVAESDRIRQTEEAQSSKTRKRPFPRDQGKVGSAQHESHAGDSKRRRMKKKPREVKET